MHLRNTLLALLLLLASSASLGGAMQQALLADEGFTVTLSGEAISDSVLDPENATASLRIDTDSNVYKIEGTTQTQIDTATDWVRPPEAAPGDFEVRFTNLVGDAPATSPTTAEDAWHALSAGDLTITISETTPNQSNTATFDIEIRLNGATKASAEYSLTATVTAL